MARPGRGHEQTIVCADGHPFKTRAAPGTRNVRCGYRFPDGTKCPKRGSVPKAPGPATPDRPAAAAAVSPGPARAAPADDGQAGRELPPASWLESLGPVAPGEPPCDSCGCSGPPVRYTGDHTGTVCPECGPACWSTSAAAVQRARDHAGRLRQAALRERRPTAHVSRQDLDARGRQAQRLQDQLLARVARVLADQRITADTRSDFAWFRAQLTPRPGEPPTPERLAELAAEIAECPVERRGWFRRALEAADYEDEDVIEAEIISDDEDQAAEVTGPPERLAIERAPVIVLCQLCGAQGTRDAAVARVRTNVPNMLPERDVCAGHFGEYRAAVEPMTFGDLIIVRQYGIAPGVASIVRSGTGAAR